MMQIPSHHVSCVTEIPQTRFYAWGTMKQIRIARNDGTQASGERRFICEWMEASLMNRWFLKTRLAEALQTHGDGSHWIESREMVRVHETAAA